MRESRQERSVRALCLDHLRGGASLATALERTGSDEPLALVKV